MSGRTFGFQASWDDVFRLLAKDTPDARRKAAAVAESINQQTEEFINRYTVTAVDDSGSITFDTAGTYTFDGDVYINGDLFITNSGKIELQGSTATLDIWFAGSDPYISFAVDGHTTSINASSGINPYGKDRWLQLTGPNTSSSNAATLTLKYNDYSGSPSGFELEALLDATSGSAADSWLTRLRAGYISSDYTELDLYNDRMEFWHYTTKLMTINKTPVGSYGGVTTYAPSGHVYAGYSIAGNYVFMARNDGSNDTVGIYDDNYNQWVWAATGISPYYSLLYHPKTGYSGVRIDNAKVWLRHRDGGYSYYGTSDGKVYLDDGIGGFSGTAAHLTTVSIGGQNLKRIGYLTSKAETKSSITDFEFDENKLMTLRPKEFIVDGFFVDPSTGMHMYHNDRTDPPPEGAVPLRRAGFVWDDLIKDHPILATDVGYDYGALLAGVVSVLQNVIKRLDALEAA